MTPRPPPPAAIAGRYEVDPVDAHAFAMFTAGWLAGRRELMGCDDDDCPHHDDELAEPNPPTREDFYLAVTAREHRECARFALLPATITLNGPKGTQR
jgi:hypothetical protein